MPHYLLAQKRGNFDMTYHHHHHVWDEKIPYLNMKRSKSFGLSTMYLFKSFYKTNATNELSLKLFDVNLCAL